MKSNISRQIGIPLTKSGRDQKIGRMVSKGCLGTLAFFTILCFSVILIVVYLMM